jgi:hypothetical protein
MGKNRRSTQRPRGRRAGRPDRQARANRSGLAKLHGTTLALLSSDYRPASHVPDQRVLRSADRKTVNAGKYAREGVVFIAAMGSDTRTLIVENNEDMVQQVTAVLQPGHTIHRVIVAGRHGEVRDKKRCNPEGWVTWADDSTRPKRLSSCTGIISLLASLGVTRVHFDVCYIGDCLTSTTTSGMVLSGYSCEIWEDRKLADGCFLKTVTPGMVMRYLACGCPVTLSHRKKCSCMTEKLVIFRS